METSSDIMENYQRLAAAILAEAVYSYRSLCRRLIENEHNPNAAAWGMQLTKASMKLAEDDFASDYYAILLKGIGSDLDGSLIPKFIRKQEEERYARRCV